MKTARTMKTSNKGIGLIKLHEGCRLEAYKCPAGVWTIGYGHTGSDVAHGMKISSAEAERILIKDLERFEAAVNKNLPTLSQNQFDALVSFVFNVGIGSFENSTLLKKARKEPADYSIRDEFMRWNKGGGRLLTGLINRRNAESELYFTK